MTLPVSGAIIAAGRGERLRQATAGLPKPLVELDGQSLLVRQIKLMQAEGLERVYAIVNTETAQLIEGRGIVLPAGVKLVVADTPNSMESLLVLGKEMPPGELMLATVDAIAARSEFRYFFARTAKLVSSDNREAAFDGALGVATWRGDARPLFVQIGPEGSIIRIGEAQGEWVTAGFYRLPTRIFDYADEARARGLDALRQFLAFLLSKGMRLGAVEMTDVVDVDEAADLDQARALVAARREQGASG